MCVLWVLISMAWDQDLLEVVVLIFALCDWQWNMDLEKINFWRHFKGTYVCLYKIPAERLICNKTFLHFGELDFNTLVAKFKSVL